MAEVNSSIWTFQEDSDIRSAQKRKHKSVNDVKSIEGVNSTSEIETSIEEYPKINPQSPAATTTTSKTRQCVPLGLVACLLVCCLATGIGFRFANSLAPPLAQPLAWLSQLAAGSTVPGSTPPKLSHAPLVQLDTSSSYYKTMVEGMMQNFKRNVHIAGERFSLANMTIDGSSLRGPKPVSLVATTGGERVNLYELSIEGLDRAPKVTSVWLDKKRLVLNVNFDYRSIRVLGKCATSGALSTTPIEAQLLEANHWNVSWSASVIKMIGREHFDLSKVHINHNQQQLSVELCAQSNSPSGLELQSRLRSALIDRVKQQLEARVNEVMEVVIMQQGANSNTDQLTNGKLDAIPTAKLANMSDSQRPLKRTKRQTPCQQGEDLDDYVDQLFRFGTRIVRAMEPVSLPNATVELPDYNLKIFLYEGKGTRAYKFRRAKSAWVFCSNETISLGITIELEELRVAYKYRVISGNRLLFDGDLEAKLSPKVQAQFSQAVQEEDSEEPVQQRVDRIRVFRLGRVHVVIRGLGNLTQSLSMLINSYLNDNQEELQPTFRMVEGDAVRLINKMLANVNVPLLSVV